jgi:hypothetical protein
MSTLAYRRIRQAVRTADMTGAVRTGHGSAFAELGQRSRNGQFIQVALSRQTAKVRVPARALARLTVGAGVDMAAPVRRIVLGRGRRVSMTVCSHGGCRIPVHLPEARGSRRYLVLRGSRPECSCSRCNDGHRQIRPTGAFEAPAFLPLRISRFGFGYAAASQASSPRPRGPEGRSANLVSSQNSFSMDTHSRRKNTR